MKKFWVNVEKAKHPRPDDKREYTAVYGVDINDAVSYAYDYLVPSFGIWEVTICAEDWRTIYHKIW